MRSIGESRVRVSALLLETLTLRVRRVINIDPHLFLTIFIPALLFESGGAPKLDPCTA